jgi:hypothetical protein
MGFKSVKQFKPYKQIITRIVNKVDNMVNSGSICVERKLVLKYMNRELNLSKEGKATAFTTATEELLTIQIYMVW